MAAKNNEGQAILEVVFFIPFFIFVILLIVTVGNSINGSINQQKSTRRYLFNLIKGNSYIISQSNLKAYQGGIRVVGNYSLGWQEDKDGTLAIATCYELKN